MNEQNVFIKALRWLLVVPVTLIVFTVAFFVLGFIGQLIPLYSDLPWLLLLITSAVSYGVSIFFGVLVAPSYRSKVAIVLSVLMFITAVSPFFIGDGASYIELIGGSVGIIVGGFISAVAGDNDDSY